MMTPEQVDLVRKSFDALWPVRRKLADVFYSRFFELAPDARALPTGYCPAAPFMDMIAAIVGALDKREIFQSIISISYSGCQHALTWRREQQFGAAFTPELKQAWITLYDAVQRE
jgi:hypothetical protein